MIVDGLHAQLLILVVCIATVYVGLFLWAILIGVMDQVVMKIERKIEFVGPKATRSYELER